MEQVTSIERQVAKKVRLSDLTEGTYVRVEGKWEPNFIQTGDGRTFSRANIIAVVATEPVPDINFNTFIIDDGSARVPVRIFGESSFKVNLGDVVRIIGRPREFNQQIYIAPEIIKQVKNTRWIEHRKLELSNLPASVKLEKVPAVEKPKAIRPEPAVEKIEEKDSAHDVQPQPKSDNPVDKILEKIAELDNGDGADVEDVITASGIANAEKILDNLMKEGEIFEITSGRIKVLE